MERKMFVAMLGAWLQTVDTHRSELRELNELHFACIDSRMNAMESRLGEIRHEMRAEFSEHRRETQASLGMVAQEIGAAHVTLA